MMFVLAVCSALLAAGGALECEVCYAINSNTCSGHYEHCKSPRARCTVTLTEKTLQNDNGEMRSVVLEKSCGSVHSCSHPATLTTEEFRVRVTTMCCSQNYCNNGTVSWTALNSTENGLSCPSCFARNSQTCDVKSHVNCTGAENHCVQYSATREGGFTITVAGCASESMERSNGGIAFRGSSVAVHGMQNKNNGDSVRHNALLLSFLSIVTILPIYSQ
ncbi:phospholipase A2 inhibitor and Ly6/PLAUR domain-containing protein-like [Hyla sarda]|uniref:phospholipase A2 inhibitor and Ly6/PLAUR domain-containing protein-like n=1 Tax=Hyla sarda TaxID=327740 RepID=UPI0024C20EAA|nr:phospholipase A2 inhibitor and Ly6/PLAUR domain-containing protein-like [Hyla sarda]